MCCDSIPILFFFFFQAEDGIRDSSVTGVQTCALPISVTWLGTRSRLTGHLGAFVAGGGAAAITWGDRESVVEGKRGDLGGRRIIKKKKRKNTIKYGSSTNNELGYKMERYDHG